MKTSLKFGLDEFEPVLPEIDEDYELAKADRFTKVKIRLFGDGENAHTNPVDMEALKNSADSAYDIPLIAELNPYRNNEDFGGHGTLTGSEFSFGFIKDSKDNPIVFEKDEKTGKTFITLYGLIWKKYFSNVLEIIKSHNDEVEVSVELDIVKGKLDKNNKPTMKQFVLNAITFLGKVTTAACQGANATLCFSADDDEEFKKDKSLYIQQHFSEDIEIVNTKEAAVDGKWSNPRLKLLTPILKASNKKALLNEAYLFCNNVGEDEITLSDVSYPHHIVKNGKLVLHIRGVQAAFSRLSQQGEVEGKAKAHLLRHYKELGLTTENFEDFGLTKEQFELYFAEDCGKEDNGLDSEKTMTAEIKEPEIKEEGEIIEEENKEVVEEGCEPEVKEENFEDDSDKEEADKEEDDSDKDDDEDDKDADDDKDDTDDEGEEEMSSDDGVPPQPPLQTASEVSVDELKQRIEKLEAENTAYLEKIEAMADYEELKEFKCSTIEKMEKEKELLEMSKVFEDMESRGVTISEDTKTQLFENRQEFTNLDAWSNYVKAYAFDNCEKTEEGIVKFEMPTRKTEDDSKYGVWASLK